MATIAARLERDHPRHQHRRDDHGAAAARQGRRRHPRHARRADGDGHVRAADRVRQRRQHAAGPRIGPRTRDRGSHRDWRQPVAPRASDAHRKRCCLRSAARAWGWYSPSPASTGCCDASRRESAAPAARSRIDLRVFAAGAAATCIAGIVTGLVPATSVPARERERGVSGRRARRERGCEAEARAPRAGCKRSCAGARAARLRRPDGQDTCRSCPRSIRVSKSTASRSRQ